MLLGRIRKRDVDESPRRRVAAPAVDDVYRPVRVDRDDTPRRSLHAEERTDGHGGPEACFNGADLRVFGLREHVLAENVYRHAAAAGRALDVEAIEDLLLNRGYGITPWSRYAKSRCPRSVDPRHDAEDSRARLSGVNRRVDEQSAVWVVFARYPYLSLVVGLAVAQRRVGVSVGQELARYLIWDCPRTPGSDAAETVDDQGADASLGAVAGAAPLRVVVQVDLSGVDVVDLGYGMPYGSLSTSIQFARKT